MADIKNGMLPDRKTFEKQIVKSTSRTVNLRLLYVQASH
jgi:hypothetical protein